MRLTYKAKALIAIGVLLLALSLAGKIEHATSAPVGTSSPTEEYCEEDMPCWDCSTMGNLICGPGVK